MVRSFDHIQSHWNQQSTGFWKLTKAEIQRMLEEKQNQRQGSGLEASCFLDERKDGTWELETEMTWRLLGNEIVKTWRLMRWDC